MMGTNATYVGSPVVDEEKMKTGYWGSGWSVL